jgi:hypothetical protein
LKLERSGRRNVLTHEAWEGAEKDLKLLNR